MKKFLTFLAAVLGLTVLVAVGAFYAITSGVGVGEPFAPLYAENCAVCHGESFEGAALGPALVGRELTHGDTVNAIARSIAEGFPECGMPPWAGVLDDGQIRSLAILIGEKRVGRVFTDFKTDQPLAIPAEPFDSELHRFRLETVTTGLSAKPFSIAPLPDGRILVTEKTEGLRIVAADGERSEPIPGIPAVGSAGFDVMGLDFGHGWLLDVAPHPDYETSGWIYLLHTHLCEDCAEDGGGTLLPMTMSRLVRGRISDDGWVDEEVIWQVAKHDYTLTPDLGAGGRLAFDPSGYVFLTVGMKGTSNFDGIQDLGKPYGKIHRVLDDGRIPQDNPFASNPGAVPSTWTYGHRSPQGLEFDPATGKLWGTEMGPRGGDELNLLQPGSNYGWPLYSKGVDYDGTPVEYWKELGIEFDLEDIEQPIVDLTPSPAVSSFIIYAGDAFPGWRGSFLVGSLKATELYRFVIEDDTLVHSELLIDNLARIRDIESGPDGTIYLLLEHDSGSQIVRMVPEDPSGPVTSR
jgi:glucose/arabinose dehydrogenase